MKLWQLVSVAGAVATTLAVAAAQDNGAATKPRLTFEVATIKPSAAPAGGRGGGGRANILLTPGDRFVPSDGYVTIPGITVLRLIAFAYSMDSNPDPQLNALPDWAKTARWDIEARADHPATKDEYRAMVKSLLEDRFHMVVHTEVRNVPAYNLVMSKPGHFGPQMRVHVDEGIPCDGQPEVGAPAAAAPAQGAVAAARGGAAGTAAAAGSAGGGDAVAGGGGRGGQRATPDGYPINCGDMAGLPGAPPGRSRLGGRNVTMADFMATLRGGMDRPVVDQTGLTGRYDWWIEYVPDPATDGAQVASSTRYLDPDGPKLWTAFKEQLGLELKAVKTDVPWMVFDRIEKPTEN